MLTGVVATIAEAPTPVALTTTNDVDGKTTTSSASAMHNNNSNNDNTDWRLWCRLCAKDDPQGNISVFFKDEQQSGVLSRETAVCTLAGAAVMSLATAIGKYFWVEIKRDDDLPKMLCTECFSLVTSLVNFSERVAKVQQMFGVLLNSALLEVPTLDLHAMRLKYGLLDEEREHIIMQQQLPEVHYFESKPKINDLEECIFGNETLMATNTRTTKNPLEQQQQQQEQQQQQQQPRIRIKIKKEDILDNLNGEDVEQNDDDDHDDDHDNDDSPDDDDDEHDEDGELIDEVEDINENTFNEVLCNDADLELEQSNTECSSKVDPSENAALIDKHEEAVIKDQFMPLKLRGRRIKRMLKPLIEEKDETLEQKPKKRRRRRRKRKQAAAKDDNEGNVNELTDEDDDDDAEDDVGVDNAAVEETATEHVANGEKSLLTSKLKLPADCCIYTCSDCPRKYKRLQHLHQHMKRAHAKTTQPAELPCSQCPKVFTTMRQLETHEKIHLPPELRKVVPCPYCKKKFTSHTLMQAHIKYIHMNERPFICEECGVATRTNAALKAHMLTHTDYAPFECEVCKKGFKNQIRLKNHMEIHDPNKHICAKCGLQLNSRATLNRHLLVHSDEMQHKCDYCGRAFKRAKALKNHLILHTGLKPYSCDFCDRTFANGSNCRSHKKKAHPEELAALEAAGGGKPYTRNIPKLEALKAVTKAADNLAPVVSKQSGRFAFGKKPKLVAQEDDMDKESKTELISDPNKTSTLPTSISAPNATAINSTTTSLMLNNAALPAPPNLITLHSASMPTTSTLPAATNQVTSMSATSIPNIDNIYSHIMKQATMAVQSATHMNDAADIAIHIKRPISQASSCITIENDGASSDMPLMLHQQHSQQQGPLSHTHNHQTMQSMPTHLYTQIIKQNMLQQQEQHHQQQQQLQEHLHQHHHQHHQHQLQQQHISVQQQQQLIGDDINSSSIRSPESQASSTHLTTDDHSNQAASVQFYNHLRQNLQGPYI